MTMYHNFDIDPDTENEASVTLIEMQDRNVGASFFDLTVAEGELEVDEEELKAELIDIVESESSNNGETTINVDGQNLHILYELDRN